MTFYFSRQQNQMDCGPTCLYMVSRYYGRVFGLNKLRQLSEIGKEGVNMLGISDAGEQIGFQTTALKLNFDKLMIDSPKPAILHWGQNHFIVLPPQKKTPFSFLFNQKHHNNITIADPAKGILTISKELFLLKWISDKNTDGEPTGIALLLEPGPNFYNNAYGADFDQKTTKHASQLLSYIRPHKN